MGTLQGAFGSFENYLLPLPQPLMAKRAVCLGH
jgi:hypothetical protein